LRRIKQFYDQGGTVIATTCLPDRAAEFGADAEVRQLVAEIFGDSSACHRNGKGGKAWFLPAPGVAALNAVLDRVGNPSSVHAAGRAAVFVGRLREDISHPRGLNMWVVSDNIRKGAALNAVQIAELWLKNRP